MKSFYLKRKTFARILFMSILMLNFMLETLHAQDITQKMDWVCQNEPMPSVLKRLEQASGFKILFTYDEIQDFRVTTDLKSQTVEKILQEIIASFPLTYKINGKFIGISLSKNIRRLQGRVYTKTNEPLAGVTIRTEHSDINGISDYEGHFNIVIPAGREVKQVSFSYISMQPVTLAFDGKPLNVMMEEDIQLMDDVVITGYQQLDRRKLTSSVSSVRMEDIQIPGYTNLTQMLESKIPDMVVSTNSGEINATPKLRIRGSSTIIGNREPLWVLDGVILTDPVNLSPDVLNDPDYINRIGNAIAGINPQDIERLDVLKDAAATALYGTRAANGVIVVTTKKGRVGKPIISYSATATVRRRPYYTDSHIDLMNSQERVQFSQDLVSKHYVYPSNMPKAGYEAVLSDYYAGIYTPDEFQAEVAKLQTMNTDWFDILTHNSFSHDHNVNISGGSEKIRYYASVGYTDEDDVINHTTNNRYTGTAKIDVSLNNKWQLSFNMNAYMNDREYNASGINPIDYAYNTSRAIPAYEADGTYAYYQKYVSPFGYLNYNILNELENSYTKQNITGLTATMNLRYKLTDWLNLNAIVSANTTSTEINTHYGEKTFYAASLRGWNYGETYLTDDIKNVSALPFGGELNSNNSKSKGFTARLQANLNKYLGDNNQHFINVTLGAEASSNRYSGYVHTQRGYYEDRGKSFMNDLNTTDYPAYTSWALKNVPSITDSRTNMISGYLTASYGYQEYFTVNANTRFDGSNKFGSRSNEKLLPVWSVSMNANLKEIMKLKTNWLDMLSMKASYGEQGNMIDGQTPVLILKHGSYSSYYQGMTSTVAGGGYANPDLKWEKTHSTNVGLEASFLKGRIQLGAEYYYKKTTDAFMNKVISDVNGFNSYVVNGGDVVNKGYNFNITSIPVRTRNFNWILSGSLSKVMNEMKTAPGQETYELSDFLNGTAIVKGQPIGTFYSYRFVGLNPEDGGPMFDDWEDRKSELEGLSKYDTYTKVLVASGRRTPDITGSINNTFSYKNFRLNVGLTYSLGASTRLFRMMDDFVSGYSSESNVNRAMLDAWKKPGDERITNVPAIMGQSSNGYYTYLTHWSTNSSSNVVKIADSYWTMYDYSDARVVSADYLKLQNVSLTYEFPKKILDMWKLQRLALTLGATNLYTFCDSKLKGQTPVQGGFSEVQLSDTPTYTIGLTLNF